MPSLTSWTRGEWLWAILVAGQYHGGEPWDGQDGEVFSGRLSFSRVPMTNGWAANWAMKKTLVCWVIKGIILPSYIGNIISHYKDPYKPTSIMESNKAFFFFVAQLLMVISQLRQHFHRKGRLFKNKKLTSWIPGNLYGLWNCFSTGVLLLTPWPWSLQCGI